MTSAERSIPPVEGEVVISPIKTAWFIAHACTFLVAAPLVVSWDAVAVSFVFTLITLCLGHSIGLHRLLVHRSFRCPRWLEYALVHLGVVVGMGGPFRILYMHDIRDWAQRHPQCHAIFTHQSPIWRDFLWQMFGEVKLAQPPTFTIEPSVANDRVYQWMERTWMLQQLPWALLLYACGGWAYVVWAMCGRVAISLLGHWLVGYLAHNHGTRQWHLRDHAVQGYNVTALGLLTMGEAWHNNHHAFPGSARLGLNDDQHDPGWWALCALRRLGLIWEVVEPSDLPARPELQPIKDCSLQPAPFFAP